MAWDIEWAAERAAEAMRYLAQHYPEASASPELHPHQDTAHDAAAAEDEGRYLEALRGYMRAGRDEVLRIRKDAA